MYKEIEGLLQEQPKTLTCKLCGTTENLDEYNSSAPMVQNMIDNHVCYSCAFWMQQIENPRPQQEVIGGHLYIVNPQVKRPDNAIKGMFGKEVYIRRFDESLLKTNNIWHIGEIPKHFLEHYPDTANFLSLFVYQKLKNYPFKCQAKGCWDRYHCIRYDLSNEKNGPFNKIPDKYTVGSENCPSFINFNVLKQCP